MYYLISIGLVATIAYQAWVSGQVWAAAEYEPTQKRLQLALIWLLPVAGAALAHAFLRNSRKPLPAANGLLEKQEPEVDAFDALDLFDRR